MPDLQEAESTILRAEITRDLLDKWRALVRTIQDLPAAVVAFSGGVDSSLLAYVTFLIQRDQMTALTAWTPFEAPEDFERAANFCRQYGIPHTTLELDPLQNPAIRTNPTDRCYLCKRDMLEIAQKFAREHGYGAVFEGQNADDVKVYRPGRKAVTETGTHSPLLACKLSKADIRSLAHILDLPVWNQPSAPCLATRFPYGTPLQPEDLQRVHLAEVFLRQKGFHFVRVRCHGSLARIEVEKSERMQLLECGAETAEHLKSLGFAHITLDLEGYRSGTFDEGLTQ